jgi:hypothetical protein
MIALDADHRSLYNIDVQDPGFATIREEIGTALEDARLRIVNGSPECSFGIIFDRL